MSTLTDACAQAIDALQEQTAAMTGADLHHAYHEAREIWLTDDPAAQLVRVLAGREMSVRAGEERALTLAAVRLAA